MQDMDQTEAPGSSRPNFVIAGVVDAGMMLNEQLGKKMAAAYLTEQGVPFSVIVRVLAEPLRRCRPRS